MGWLDILSLVLNILFGGGLIFSLLTLKAQKNKANAEAKGAEASAESTEIDNVEKVAGLWRGIAESMEARYKQQEENNAQLLKNYNDVLTEVKSLRTEVRKQNSTISKILKILDSIDHENLEEKIQEAKQAAG